MEALDTASVFNDDFSYFYAPIASAEPASDEAFTLVSRLVGKLPGQRILDPCCGEGVVGERLAAAGARVTSLDHSSPYVALAAARAAAPGSSVRYLVADARRLPFRASFDVVVCWYSSFGCLDDATGRSVLSELRRALRPDGRVLIDLEGRDHLLHSALPTQVRERGDDLMVEQFRWEQQPTRVRVSRTVARGEELRRSSYFVRVFSEPEIVALLEDCGFARISCHDEEGARFTAGARRMIVSARRPLLAR